MKSVRAMEVFAIICKMKFFMGVQRAMRANKRRERQQLAATSKSEKASTFYEEKLKTLVDGKLQIMKILSLLLVILGKTMGNERGSAMSQTFQYMIKTALLSTAQADKLGLFIEREVLDPKRRVLILRYFLSDAVWLHEGFSNDDMHAVERQDEDIGVENLHALVHKTLRLFKDRVDAISNMKEDEGRRVKRTKGVQPITAWALGSEQLAELKQEMKLATVRRIQETEAFDEYKDTTLRNLLAITQTRSAIKMDIDQYFDTGKYPEGQVELCHGIYLYPWAMRLKNKLYWFIKDDNIRERVLCSITEATDYRSAVYGALAMLRTVYMEMQANLTSARENEYNAKAAYDEEMYSKRVLLPHFKVSWLDLFSNDER